MTRPNDSHAMRCMEIWGGSEAVETDVSTPGLDAWVYSRPFEGAARGGDVHYVSLCGGGLITRVIVADVSGHGDSVSEISLALRNLMRRNINRKSQTKLVGDLNRQFSGLAETGRFATAVVGTYLASKRHLSVCNAGHPRPLWYCASRSQWGWLTHELGDASGSFVNLPLGIEETAPYEQFAVPLGRGDLVLFYTDALIEAADASGALLGETGLLALVRTLDTGHPRGLGRALLRALDGHRGGRPPDDDVTLLTLHHTAGPKRRPSLGEKLDVYAKVFGLKSV